jgi:hypothetical protein
MSLQSLGISKMNLADRKGRGTPLLIRRKRIANAPILVIDIPRDFSREFSHTSSLCEQDHMATVPELSPGPRGELRHSGHVMPRGEPRSVQGTLNAAPSSPATTPVMPHTPTCRFNIDLLSPFLPSSYRPCVYNKKDADAENLPCVLDLMQAASPNYGA